MSRIFSIWIFSSDMNPSHLKKKIILWFSSFVAMTCDFLYWYDQPVDTFNFYFGFGLFWSLWNRRFRFVFFDIVDLISVNGFVFNLALVLFFHSTGLVFIFVSNLSSTFNKLPFVLIVGITHKILDLNRSYYIIYKTTPIAIISSIVLNNWSFKRKYTTTKRL